AVVNSNLIDWIIMTEIQFPPRIGCIFGGMGLTIIRKPAAAIAINGTRCSSPVGRAALGGFSLRSNVVPAAVDFHFSEGERFLLARQVDANKASARLGRR